MTKTTNKKPVIEKQDVGSTPTQLILIKKRTRREEFEWMLIAFLYGITIGTIISELRKSYDKKEKTKAV